MNRKLGSGTVELALAHIVRADCVADTWRMFCTALEGLGLDLILYGSSRLPLTRAERLEDTLVLMNGPDDYAETFLNEEFYLQSAAFEWGGRQERGFVTWTEALRQLGSHPSPKASKINALNASYGVQDGLIGSLNHIIPGRSGVIAVTSSKGMDAAKTERVWTQAGDAIQILSETMHLRIASLPQIGLFPPLTSRQLEVLYWYSEGKLVQDVATIMGISSGTVEKHMRMAREALDAETTAHAVRKATSFNLLTD